MCAAIVTATIVVMTSSPSSTRIAGYRDQRLLQVLRREGRARGRPTSWFLVSDFLRRLSGRLFSVAVVIATHAAQIFQNSTPNR